jgi:Fe-S-cluster-containing hydrogenase component 2
VAGRSVVNEPIEAEAMPYVCPSCGGIGGCEPRCLASAIVLDAYDSAPFVCPGCYAVGEEQCAGYCPDAAIEREREESLERDWEPLDLNDAEDWEYVP